MNTRLFRVNVYTKHALTLAAALLFAFPVMAGDISYPDNSYSPGDTLTADDLNAKFNEIKVDVNDNDNRISALEGLTPPANLNQLLNGTYNFIELLSCLEATTISPGFVPSGFILEANVSQFGTANFDGAGNFTRALNSTFHLIPVGPGTLLLGTANLTCTGNYTVHADRTVTTTGVSCNMTYTGGPLAVSGLTGTFTGIVNRGIVNATGTVLITNHAEGNISRLSLSNGYVADRLCSSTGHMNRQ